jgi:hypothetical protein
MKYPKQSGAQNQSRESEELYLPCIRVQVGQAGDVVKTGRGWKSVKVKRRTDAQIRAPFTFFFGLSKACSST